MAHHFRLLTIKDIRKETPDCVSVSFEIPEDWKEEFHFTHGQNITLKTDVGGDEIRRSYSICSSPLDEELRIAIKKIPNGKFSSHANGILRKGDRVEVLPPSGKFFTRLHATQAKNYLALVAGSGITPVISIIKTTLATEPLSSFTLVYGNRDHHSIIFREALEAIKNKYMARLSIHYVFSREKTEAAIYQGRVDAEKCRTLFQQLISLDQMDDIFICGPEEMIFGIRHLLEERGFPKEKIHFELFTVPGQKINTENKKQTPGDRPGGETSQVAVKLDGIGFEFQLAYHGESICL